MWLCSRIASPLWKSAPKMDKPLIIEEQPLTPELARLFEQARRNL